MSDVYLNPSRQEAAPAMKVALTGATGFIGSHILTELQDHGHEVIGIVHDDPDTEIGRASCRERVYVLV